MWCNACAVENENGIYSWMLAIAMVACCTLLTGRLCLLKHSHPLSDV